MMIGRFSRYLTNAGFHLLDLAEMFTGLPWEETRRFDYLSEDGVEGQA